MIITFGELISEVIRGLGLDEPTVETRVLDSIKLRINEAQDAIAFNENWEWRKRTFYLTTKHPHTTGTIAVTQGSKVVDGTGTAWPDTVRNGYLLIDSNIYKVQQVVSSIQLKLVTPYDKDTATELSYQIIFPDEALNHELSSIVNVSRNGIPLSIKHKSRLGLTPTSVGTPQECALSDRSSEDWYNTGTVSVTNGSTSITGAGTNWTSEMEGMTFRVNEFAKNYTVKSVNSTTSITLKESYDGATGVAKLYKINPVGTQILTFRGAPDDYYVIEVEGLISLPRLVNNNDISLIPNHMPLIRGSIWLALSDLEAKNPVRIQQAQADFIRTLKQLKDSYKIITNVQWKSEDEFRIHKSFNPLER